MKKFDFRLEKVLDFKRQVEFQKRQALSVKVEILKKEKNRLLTLTAKKESYTKIYNSLMTGKIEIDDLKTALRYIDRIKKEMFIQAKNVVKAEVDVDQCKTEVRESIRDRKKYESLREKYLEKYELDANRAEQKELDEISSNQRRSIKLTGR